MSSSVQIFGKYEFLSLNVGDFENLSTFFQVTDPVLEVRYHKEPIAIIAGVQQVNQVSASKQRACCSYCYSVILIVIVI